MLEMFVCPHRAETWFQGLKIVVTEYWIGIKDVKTKMCLVNEFIPTLWCVRLMGV